MWNELLITFAIIKHENLTRNDDYRLMSDNMVIFDHSANSIICIVSQIDGRVLYLQAS